MDCPKCGHKMHKFGFVWSGSNRVQRWQCQKCGATTIKKQEEKKDA